MWQYSTLSLCGHLIVNKSLKEVIMYSAKPFFNVPADEQTMIWRYMDFTKFVSLLDKKALYFTRSDRFSDKFEGAIPKPTVEAREALVLGLESTFAEETLRVMSQGSQELRKWIFLNCWHMNSNESAAMWQLYVQKNDGIAIRSTFARLRDSLSSHDMLIGMVNYIDYDRTMIPYGNAFHALFCKRRSFEHEHELRVVILKPSKAKDLQPGLYIPCDLDILIDEIFVSPASPSWFKELVSSILEKYSIDKEAKRSNLDEDPLY
jgi:hypothetical protein